MYLNQNQLIGRIASDPVLSYNAEGNPRLKFTLVTNDGYLKDDQWVQDPVFHPIVVFGARAEKLAQKIKKGDLYLVIGATKLLDYGDTKYYNVVASTIRLLARKRESLESREDLYEGANNPEKDNIV
jgi:single-stranded DNA-binding protein